MNAPILPLARRISDELTARGGAPVAQTTVLRVLRARDRIEGSAPALADLPAEAPTAQIIASVRRELATRRNLFPQFVADGILTQDVADHEIACFAQVLELLEHFG